MKSINARIYPATTAIVCMEMQRGIVGDLSPLSHLSDAVNSSRITPKIVSLLNIARSKEVQIIYCNAIHRRDRKGSATNAPMLAATAKFKDFLFEGTPTAENIPEITPLDTDFVSNRYHGLSPFTGTSLDVTLRNMGIKTIIATGVSLNVGIQAMCCEAVALGYQVVVATDCVVGVPREYGDAVIKYSLSTLATLTTAAEIIACWKAFDNSAPAPD